MDQPSPPHTGPAAGGSRAGLLTIGAFARRSRLSPRALRLYERQGLLVPTFIDEDNGYRYYRHEQLETARLIAQLRRLDMPLAHVAGIVAAPDERAADLLTAYWDGVEHRQDTQRRVARRLQERLSGRQPRLPLDLVRERTVEARTYLVEQHHVLKADLAVCIQQSATRMMALADAYSARAGEFTFVYHREVSEDSDGPIELCLPVDPDTAAKARLNTRVDPPHRQAYIRLRKSETGYPQLLAAYDALFAWVDQRHATYAGPPREIYLGHYPDARPDDEICDVALPFQ